MIAFDDFPDMPLPDGLVRLLVNGRAECSAERNDVCGSVYIRGKVGVWIWIDHPVKELREGVNSKRYRAYVVYERDYADEIDWAVTDHSLYETDDPVEFEAWLAGIMYPDPNRTAANWYKNYCGTPNRQHALKLATMVAEAQIRSDIEDENSDIAHCTSYSELHDYVDANYYGNAFEVEAMPNEDWFASFWNIMQGNIDEMLKEGKFASPNRV